MTAVGRVLRCVLTVVLVGGAATACGAEPQIVPLGGAPSGVVERPWGTVRTFPSMKKAQPPAPSDARFVAQMVVHHEQAVQLSELVLGHTGIDGRVEAAARFIAQDQTREIETMEAWLTAWKVTSPIGEHSHHMPGMVDDSQVRRLADLVTSDAQGEFVRLMILHHEGAVEMSTGLLGEGTNDFALAVARHLIREQGVEIRYLRGLSADLYSSVSDGRPR